MNGTQTHCSLFQRLRNSNFKIHWFKFLHGREPNRVFGFFYFQMPFTVWPNCVVNVSLPRVRLRWFGSTGAAVSDGLRRAGGVGRVRLYSATFIFRIWLSPRFYIAVSTSRINRIRDAVATSICIYRNYDFY